MITFLKEIPRGLQHTSHLPSGPVSGQRSSSYSQLQHHDSRLRVTPESRCGCVLSQIGRADQDNVGGTWPTGALVLSFKD